MDVEKLREFVAQFTSGDSTIATDNGDYSDGRYCLFCGWNESKGKIPVHEPDCVVVEACQLLGIEYKPEYVTCPVCGKENADDEGFEEKRHLCKSCYNTLREEYWNAKTRHQTVQSKLDFHLYITPAGRLIIS